MNDDHSTLRAISWRDLCPWLILFRSFGLAIRFEILLLATAGAFLSAIAWWLSGALFYWGGLPDARPTSAAVTEVEAREKLQADRFKRIFEDMQRMPGQPQAATGETDLVPPGPAADSEFAPPAGVWPASFGPLREPFFSAWQRLARPYFELFGLHVNLRQFAYFLFGGLLTLVIWSIIGGAITRSTALQLAREERIGLRAALRFSTQKFLSYFTAPLYPLLGIALFAAAVFVFVGLPMGYLDVGLFWGGLVWLLVLLVGLLVGVLALGLIFGWPLMWATISTEGTDAFDALSRSYAYTLQRPLHYLFYAVVAALLGTVSWLLVILFGEAVIHISLWGAAWGISGERFGLILAAANGSQAHLDQLSSIGQAGAAMLGLSHGVVRAFTFSFAIAFFWTATTAIYLLLRRDVDQTEIDEVHADDEAELYGLPPLEKDQAGVAGVADEKMPRGEPASDDDAAGPAMGDGQEGAPADSAESSPTGESGGDEQSKNE